MRMTILVSDTYQLRFTIFTYYTKNLIRIEESGGRVVNIYDVPTNASNEDLLEYKQQSALDDSEIDDECCWGVAYQISDDKWEEESFQLKVEKNNPDGFVSTRKTFYPVVSKMIRMCFLKIQFLTLKIFEVV